MLCSLIKTFLRKLPNPLIPFDEFDAFVEVTEYSPEDRAESLKELVAKLNLHHAALLQFLCAFWQYVYSKPANLCSRISLKSKENQMTVTNLASLIAPNILYRKNQAPEHILMDSPKVITVVEVLIASHESIFADLPKQSVCIENTLYEAHRVSVDARCERI